MSLTQSTLIRNATVVCEYEILRRDVLLQDARIQLPEAGVYPQADRIIDAEGLLVFPGAVDPHVHFNDEFMGTVSVHDYTAGTLAAAYGGVTSLLDFSNQAPQGSLMQALEIKFKEAQGKALVDWGVHPVITRADSRTLSEIREVVKAGAPTIKCYMTYPSEGLMMEEPELLNILSRLEQENGMLLLHAEDNDMIESQISSLIKAGKTQAIFHARSRPPQSEDNAIKQAVRISQKTGGRVFIVHLASDLGLERIHQAQLQGINILCETCTHYLVFTDAWLEREDGFKWICSPPLRAQPIQQKLWKGLQDGVISLVSSDDAAFSWEAKLLGKDRFDLCPNGIPGIEARVSVMFSEGVKKDRLTLSQMVDLIATMPARLFGLYPRKGVIAPGSDADLVLFDPNQKWTMGMRTQHMASDWSAYEGIEITGKIRKVFSRGELIIDGEKCLARAGRGQYLHRSL